MSATTVNDESWEAVVLGLSQIVIVGVCSSESGPCRGFRSVVDELAVELTGVARVVSIDLEDNPAVARRYDVSSLPTLLVFREGRLHGRLIGARPRDRLLRDLYPYLA